MVNFSRDDVYNAAAAALVSDCPNLYVRLRDAVRRDAEKTLNYQDYKRFIKFSDEMVMGFMLVYPCVFTDIGFSICDNEDDFNDCYEHLKKYMRELTIDETLDDDVSRAIINAKIYG